MKLILKILLIGILTTFSRIIGQLLIPAGTQSVLEPSVFAINETMPLVFTIYGIFAYSIIAGLYLLIEKNLIGWRIVKGLKYGISCCAVWVVYLWEPLPHVHPMDKITYPVADGVALLVMGLLLGLFLSNDNLDSHDINRSAASSGFNHMMITACFVSGRLIQYIVFDIYSSFASKPLQSVLWTMVTGLVVTTVVLWYERHLSGQPVNKKVFLAGGLLFGIDLILFNFFMPLVFAADIPDLILRTVIDVMAVTVGLFLIRKKSRLTLSNFL